MVSSPFCGHGATFLATHSLLLMSGRPVIPKLINLLNGGAVSGLGAGPSAAPGRF